MDIVIDASIAVKWFSGKNEDYVEEALEIQDKRISGILNIIVPDLFFLEVLNAFLTKSGFEPEDIFIIRDVLDKLDLKVVYPDNDTLKETIKIACDENLTIYDSLYMAVAKSSSAVLYTEDSKILSCRASYTFIRHLDDFKKFNV
ncbi:MAG: type II toxin-antitoxin system VapC family toxin [Actinobacteria bacterium]|nr:type II toxin-antitoxin system VapC family toxin [Actinomycetota bacterium]